MARPERSIRRATRRIRWAKGFFLFLVLATIAGLVGLYFVGRSARVRTAPPAAPEALANDEGVSQVGEGFDHTVSHEGHPLFRVRGVRDRRGTEGDVLVDEVQITLFGEEDRRYEMAADTARYSLEQKDARLVGNVRVSGPERVTLETDELRLLETGTVLESRGPVALRGSDPAFVGAAESLRAAPERGQYVLRGKVRLDSVPGAPQPFSIRANRVVYLAESEVVRAEGEVVATWGDSRLRASRAIVQLGPEGTLRSIEALWGVEATIASSGEGGSTVMATGRKLTVVMEPEGTRPRRIELESPRRERATVVLADPDGAETRLAAEFVQGDFAGDVLEVVYATKNLEIVQTPPPASGDPTRRVTAGRGEAHFTPQGEVSTVEVVNDVRIVEGETTVTAARARTDGATVRADGVPAVLTSDRGELRAPNVTLDRASGIAHATNGVQALMAAGTGNPLAETPLGGGGQDEPVRVESREAYYRDDPRAFLFLGKVRAWSGENVLLADQLRGDLDVQTLSAAGDVDTVWFSEATAEEASRQIRITAETMVYDDANDVLTYRDGVTLVESDRSLACQELRVFLDDRGEAERMACSGKVSLVAPKDGKTVRADRAEYDLAAETAIFTGDPVEVEDAQGGRLQGRQVVYRLATGRVSVSSQPAPGGEEAGGREEESDV